MPLVGGMWLSLVEHYVRDVGVVGSNPAIPTSFEGPVFRERKAGPLFFTRKVQ
jgi:hypothetical protein